MMRCTEESSSKYCVCGYDRHFHIAVILYDILQGQNQSVPECKDWLQISSAKLIVVWNVLYFQRIMSLNRCKSYADAKLRSLFPALEILGNASALCLYLCLRETYKFDHFQNPCLLLSHLSSSCRLFYNIANMSASQFECISNR